MPSGCMSTSRSKTRQSETLNLLKILVLSFLEVVLKITKLHKYKSFFQVCQRHHLPSLAVHTAHDVHTVPPGKPAADRLGGYELLLPV